MGNRTDLRMERAAGEPETVFEANNALPLFWCAAFRMPDLEPHVAAARAIIEWEPPRDDPAAEPPDRDFLLVLRVPWDAAHANLRAALDRAPSRVPGFVPRLSAFVAALEREAARLGATGLTLDAAEWVNFYSQEREATDELSRMIAVWHGDDPPRVPRMHWTFEADGIATDPALRVAQEGWPAVPLEPLPAPPPAPRRWDEWTWIAALVLAAIGAAWVTGSELVGLGAFLALAAVFVWALFRRR